MKTKLERYVIEAISRRSGADVNYALALHAISPAALKKVGSVNKLLYHRETVPVDAAYAAQIVGSLAEGCGSCVQTHIDAALNAGMSEDLIEAVLMGDKTSASFDVALAMRFARAMTFRLEDEIGAREAVEREWGPKGVVDLTLATQVSRFLSMLKYGFGYATECSKQRVGAREVFPRCEDF